MNIKLFRMSSGEDVVSELLEEKEDIVIISNPIVAVPTKDNQIGFAAWSPIMNREVKELEVNRKFIVFITEADPPVRDHYNNIFNPLSIPPEKKIIV